MTATVLLRHSIRRKTIRSFLWTALLLAAALGWLLADGPGEAATDAVAEPEHLTARSRPILPTATTIRVGEEIRTEAGQRRRLLLPDKSVLYVDQNTTLKLAADGDLILSAGRVFIEIGSRKKEAPFAVKTPKRTITGTQARVAISNDADGTGVVVTHGKVQVSGLDKPIVAGQQLVPAADKPIDAPRASHLLAWTRDLIAASESPLVPGSAHTGGALIAIDPNGQEAKLSLRKYHIDVHIEDGFARTTIDQTYFNHEPWRMEGTFHFPLPPDASLSRLAMYVDGNLMEGGMAERDYARQVFESVVYRQKDPALLEWVDGSTFKMRVFPLEGRQEKRIVLSYTQRLPVLYDRTTYRFPAGHSLGAVGDWSFHARIKNAANIAWSSDSHSVKESKEKGDLILDAAAKDVKPDKDVSLYLTPVAGARGLSKDSVLFSSAEHEGAHFLMLRYHPNLASPPRQQGERRDWVFLFESSGDRDPLLARTQIEIVRSLLSQAEADDTFVVLTAGTRVHSVSAKPQAVTRENVEGAITFLEKAHLIGALDLGHALTEAEPFLKAGKNPYLVHLGSGIAAMGERREDVLAKRIPDGTRYVGIGVGKRWARTFMKAAATRTGGYFTQINPDESISWRGFDLVATLNTPRLLDIKVEDGAKNAIFLTDINSLSQGEELWAIARIRKTPPESVTITGSLNGSPFRETLPVKNVAEHADYLPRTWARLEIDHLLSEDGRKNKDMIVALSKAMYVMTPFTSLLVLENEDMYKQYKVDRGRKDHWAMYDCPQKIKVVYEPLPWQKGDARNAPKDGPLTVEQVLGTIAGFKRASVNEQRAQPGSFMAGNGLSGDLGVMGSIAIDERNFDTTRLPTNWNHFSGQEASFLAGGEFPVPIPQTVTGGAGTSVTVTFKKFGVPLGIVPYGIGDMPRFVRNDDSARAAQLLAAYQNMSLSSESELPIPPNVVDPSRKGDIRRFRATSLDQFQAGAQNILNTQDVTASSTLIKPLPSGGVMGLTADAFGTQFPNSGKRRLDEEGWAIVNGDSPQSRQAKPEGLVINSLTYHEDLELRRRNGAKTEVLIINGADPGPVKEVLNVINYLQDGEFFDLVAYCPGMSAGLADIQAVLEAEGPPRPYSEPGNIDPEARKLFDKSRASGWQSVDLASAKPQAVVVTFDGAGRFAYERVLSFGLKERVVCDGKTILHLYPDLGIGARRTVSRFHRIAFSQLLPWVLPTADDLAHGADLKLVDEKTVALVPHGVESAKDKDGKPLPYLVIHFVFDGEGKLSEKQVVEMPSKKVLHRETANGWGKMSAAKAPDLSPDVKNLVVLPLPYRTPEHVRKTLKIEKKGHGELRFEDGLVLFAAFFGSGNGNEANNVFRQCFHNRDQRQLGFYVLLAACGLNLDAENGNVLGDHPNEPLAQYLALYSSPVLRKHASQWAVSTEQWKAGFLQHLAATHAILQRWQGNRADVTDEADLKRALDYVRQNKGSSFGLALLSLVQNRAMAQEAEKKDVAAAYRKLAETWLLFEDAPGMRYSARYEHARCLWKAGEREQARKQFRELYEKTIQAYILPPIDTDFRQALQGDGKEVDPWSEVLRETAKRMVRIKQREVILVMARQCWQLGDQPSANYLLSAALEGMPEEKPRQFMTLLAIDFLMETSQWTQADQLVKKLLDDPKLAEKPGLWRLAATLAEKRELKARELECLERALDAEYRNLPEIINLETVRRDYSRLLHHYENLAESMQTLKVQPAPDFQAKVIRTADRWRALDSNNTDACQTTARILQTLNSRDLGWDYLTTPIGQQPNESGPWVSLAQTLSRKGEVELADRAYAAAFEAEPTNAQILWDRAQCLQQADKRAEAQKLFRQLAESEWQPRFQWLKSQARQYLSQ